MGATYPLSTRYQNTLTKAPLVDQWGREIDKTWWGGAHSNGNPDDHTSEEKWDHSNHPLAIAGKIYRNIGYLWVTAAGLDKATHGVDFPPQLAYINPAYADQEIFDLVAYQLDEAFDVRFGQLIKKAEDDAKDNGRAILEIEWFVKDSDPFQNALLASNIYSRDPEPYVFNPPNKQPGLYRDEGLGKLVWKDPNKFMVFTYGGEFDNPYGRSINYPLRPWLETWPKIFRYWRHALEKAGLGAWVALYDENVMGGEDNHSKKMRALLMEQVKAIAGGTASIMGKSSELTNHKLQMEAQSFIDWYKTYSESMSLVYTGSATALLNEENGSRAAKESTDVREKSQLEQDDAQRISGDWAQFIKRVVALNFTPDQPKALPQLYIINPASIMPTTPADQQTVEEVVDDTEAGQDEQPQEEQEEQEELSALQAEEEPPVPVAVPAGNEEFPRETETPESYKNVEKEAQGWLTQQDVKRYDDVTPEEAPDTFTVKRLRNFKPVDRQLDILDDLHAAIIPTMTEKNEADAWASYYDEAVLIFAKYGGRMDQAIRNDLRVSFRQARQNAFYAGLIGTAEANGATGIEFKNLDDGHDIRQTHKKGDSMRVAADNPLLQELQLPWDFGCVCYADHYFGNDFTPDDEIKATLQGLGTTYKYYVTP